MNSLKKKRRFKLPHAFTLLFIIAIFVGILSLILSWAGVTLGDGYTVTAEQVEALKQNTAPNKWTEMVANNNPKTVIGGVIASTPIVGSGILDWFTAIPVGIKNGIWIIVFLFVLGGFINVVVKSQALEAVIGKISTKFHKEYKEIDQSLKAQSKVKYYLEMTKEGIRQTWVIIPLMLFFSFCGMSYGMAEESLAFYAIIIPVALAAGFDVWTGFLIIFIGAGAGVMGSIINPFSIGAAIDAIGDKTITTSTGIAWRSLAWILFTIASTLFIMIYAARVKRDKNKSEMKDLFAIHNTMFKTVDSKTTPKLTRRRLITAILFLMTFVIMILAMLQWDGLTSGGKNTYSGGPMHTLDTGTFGGSKGTTWIHNSEITGHTDSTYQTAWTFGGWYMGTLAAYFFIVSVILAVINKTSEKDYIETMILGAKDMLGVALAIGVARSIPYLLEKTHLKELFANGLANALKSIKTGKEILVPTLSYILYIPLTLIIPSTSGLASATFGTIGESFSGNTHLLSGTITGYAWGAGLANMVVPTYGVVIGALAITKIPYEKFLKAISKPLLMLFVLGLILMLIGGGVALSLGENQTIF